VTDSDFELAANVSLLFPEVPFFDRFAAAAKAGFRSAESWWQFDGPVPSESDLDEFLIAIDASGLSLSGMNLWAGDMPGGERGVVSHPARTRDFEANLEVVVEIALATGCRLFNALYGQRVAGETPESQDQTAVANLGTAVRMLERVGGTVLVEPLSLGLNGDYPLVTVADALGVIRNVREATGLDNIALLFDTFHLANNGEELVSAVHRAGEYIGHVQFADTPGRGEPGTGTIDFPSVLEALQAVGYAKSVACEYIPSTATVATLSWIEAMPQLRPLH
jgi:hydroxypyruvate isomerase